MFIITVVFTLLLLPSFLHEYCSYDFIYIMLFRDIILFLFSLLPQPAVLIFISPYTHSTWYHMVISMVISDCISHNDSSWFFSVCRAIFYRCIFLVSSSFTPFVGLKYWEYMVGFWMKKVFGRWNYTLFKYSSKYTLNIRYFNILYHLSIHLIEL